jgi:hypothetical protein
MRNVLSCILLITAAIGIWRFAVDPYRCNVQLKRLERQTGATLSNIGSSGARVGAREILEQLDSMPPCCHDSAEFGMIEGANQRVMGKSAEAVATFKRVLTRERRPEVFLNLGYAELENGEPDAAIGHFVTAVRFDPFTIADMPESETRRQVEAQVFEQH